MSSSKASEALFGDGDLPTTADDVLALRRLRPRAGSDWLGELGTLAEQMPGAAADLGRRRTFAGLPPFEL